MQELISIPVLWFNKVEVLLVYIRRLLFMCLLTESRVIIHYPRALLTTLNQPTSSPRGVHYKTSEVECPRHLQILPKHLSWHAGRDFDGINEL